MIIYTYKNCPFSFSSRPDTLDYTSFASFGTYSQFFMFISIRRVFPSELLDPTYRINLERMASVVWPGKLLLRGKQDSFQRQWFMSLLQLNWLIYSWLVIISIGVSELPIVSRAQERCKHTKEQTRTWTRYSSHTQGTHLGLGSSLYCARAYALCGRPLVFQHCSQSFGKKPLGRAPQTWRSTRKGLNKIRLVWNAVRKKCV